MARAKRDWQQEGDTKKKAVTSSGTTSWRDAPMPLKSRVLSQLRLLRVPVYTFFAGALVWMLLQVVGWFRPVSQPRLTIITSTYRSPLLPMNSQAIQDAESVSGSGVFRNGGISPQSQNYEAIMASIRSIGGTEKKNFLSSLLNWHQSVEVVYVNALGIVLPDENGEGTPYLLPDDYDPSVPGAKENIVPVADLLDALAACDADHKIVVFDCARIEQLWPKGILTNGFVSEVKDVANANTRKFGDIALVFSAADGERTWQGPNGHSVFGQHFVEGLQGAADKAGNKDERVTLHELVNYLANKVPRWVGGNRLGSQHPVATLRDEADDVVLSLIDSQSPGELAADDEVDSAQIERLQTAWTTHEQFVRNEKHPSDFAPTRWARFQASLVRAEQSLVAGNRGRVDRELDRLEQLQTELQDQRDQRFHAPKAWSLAAVPASSSESRTIDKTAQPTAEPSKDELPAGVASAATATQPGKAVGPALPETAEKNAEAKSVALPNVRSVDEAARVVRRYLSGEVELAEAETALESAKRNKVTLFAEAELILMLAKARAITETKPDSTWELEARHVVQQRANIEQLSDFAMSVSPEVLPWVKSDLEAAAGLQRELEDRVLGLNEAAISVGSAKTLPTAEASSIPNMKHIQGLDEAVMLRNRLVSELPFLMRAASEVVLAEGEFHTQFAKLVHQQLVAAHKLQVALNADVSSMEMADRHLHIGEVQACSSEAIESREEFTRFVETATDELMQSDAQLSGTLWRRTQVLMAIPQAHGSSPEVASKSRMRLLKRLTSSDNQAAIAETDYAGSRDELMQRRRQLASLWLSLGNHSALDLEGQPETRAAVMRAGWNRLWSEGSRPNGNEYATRVLSAAAPGGIAIRHRHRRLSSAFSWQAQRRLDDFWAGSGDDTTPWFAQSAHEYIAIAEDLDPDADGTVEAVAGYANELIELADHFRASADHSLLVPNKTALSFVGTDSASVTLRAAGGKDWPRGVARLHCSVSNSDVAVESVRRTDKGYHLSLRRKNDSGEDAVLRTSVLFRGHRCTTSFPISSSDETGGPTVVYESNLPETGAIGVQWAKTNASNSSLLFVIDASGSMGQDGRMESVRDSLLQFARAVSDSGIQVGVRVFGDRVVWDGVNTRTEAMAKADTRLLLPIRPFAGDEFRSIVASLSPKGETPLFRALLDAREDFPSDQGARTVVVISDGADNWAGTPGAPGIAELRDAYAGSEIRIDTIGFQSSERGVRQLRQIAAMSGGTAIQADEAGALLTTLFRLADMRSYTIERVTGIGDSVVHEGVLGRASAPVKLDPGTYSVSVYDREGTLVAARPRIEVKRGQLHRLRYAGAKLAYAKTNYSNDVAVVGDENGETMLRVMEAHRSGQGLEVTVGLTRESDPNWQPRDVTLRLRPRGSASAFVVRALRPNVAGLSSPAWRVRLDNWPATARFAEIEASWTADEHAPREHADIPWDGTAPSMPRGFKVTRREVTRLNDGDDVSRDVATVTVVMPREVLGDWNLRFPNEPTFSKQVWNPNSGIHTTHVQFENGQVPEHFRLEARIGDEASRQTIKATVGLRLRSISHRSPTTRRD